MGSEPLGKAGERRQSASGKATESDRYGGPVLKFDRWETPADATGDARRRGHSVGCSRCYSSHSTLGPASHLRFVIALFCINAGNY